MTARIRAPKQSSTLDARAVEAIGRFVRVLARCGCSPSDIADEVARQSRRVPAGWAPKARAALREMDDASHVLTLWFSDPAYLDRKGNPIALPLRGSGGSLETLVARVDPKVDARELLRYLVRRHALRRIGERYLPKDRILSLRGAGGPDNFRHLRGLLGMLRTQEHNGQPRRKAEGWYEVFAENPRFPISARGTFDKSIRQWGNRLLYRADSEMHRYERARKRGERTVRMALGIYRFEEGGVPAIASGRKRRRSR
jgi:Family of unknown function (DUF6502)